MSEEGRDGGEGRGGGKEWEREMLGERGRGEKVEEGVGREWLQLAGLMR